MARGNVRVRITADNDQFKREVRDTEQKLGRLQSVSRKAGGGIGLAFKTAGGVIAGAAIADQIGATIRAAQDSEVSQKKLETQLRASGKSYKQHAAEIERVIQKTSQLAGLDDEDLQDAFTNIIRVTGDVNKSLKLTGLAADFARAKHMDVAKAGELVGKVAGGNIGILSRYGIQIEEGATATEALGVLQQKFSGQAEAYGKTSAGAQDRFRVAVENLQESIGAKLLPVLTKVTNAVADFVNGMQSGTGEGGRFAESMKRVAGDVGEAVRAIRDVFKVVSPAVREMVSGVLKRFDALGQGIRGVAKIVSGILKGDFGKAWDGVKDLFGAQVKQVVGILQTSTAPFRKAGEAVGKAIAGPIKSAFEGIVGFFRDRINDLIGIANEAIRGYNKIPIAPNIGLITPIGGGGPSRSDVVSGIPNVGSSSTGRGLPHGTSSTGNRAPSGGSRQGSSRPNVPRKPNISGYIAGVASVNSGGTTAQAAALGGRKLSGAQIAQLWLGAGGNESAVDVAVAVALAESSGYTGASNVNTNGSIDRGVWQINSIHGAKSTFDPQANARAAVSISGNGRNWNPWTTYKTGAYRKYLGQAGRGSRRAVAGAAAPSVPAVVAGGKFLQGRGLQVGESKFFGGVTTNRHKHYPNDHYSGRSIDVNYAGGGGAELSRLQSALAALKQKFGGAIDFAMIEDAGTGNQHLHVTFENQSVAARGRRLVSGRSRRARRRKRRPTATLGGVLSAVPRPGRGGTQAPTGEWTPDEFVGPPETDALFNPGDAFGDPNQLPDDIALALAEAGLTKDTADDLAALRRQRAFLEARLAGARTTPTLTDDIEAVNALAPVISAIESLENAVNQGNQTAEQLLELERQKTSDLQKALNVKNSDYDVLKQAFARIVSGEIGGRIGLGFSTPSYAGAGATY